MKDLRDWVDIAFKIVLAGVGIVIGYYFSFQKQQNDDIKLVIDLATSSEAPKRIMSAAVGQAYFDQKRIPQSVLVAVFKYANTGEDQNLRAVVNTEIAASSQGDPSLQRAITKATAALPIRIYFHIRQEQDRANAKNIEQKIESNVMHDGNKIIVPGIQLVSSRDENVTLLKCFKMIECNALGTTLVDLFNKVGVPIKLSNESESYETSTAIRPNHFEVWFSSPLTVQ